MFDPDPDITRGMLEGPGNVRVKLFAVALVVCVISGCYAHTEFVYAVWGRKARATVTSAVAVGGGGFRGTRPGVEYAFTFVEPGGLRRTGDDVVGGDWPGQRAEVVAVQYTAGADGRSRLVGHHYWGGVAVFAGCTLAVVGFTGWLWRDAVAATREPPRRRRRRDRE